MSDTRLDIPTCPQPPVPVNRIAETKGGQNPVVNGKHLESHGRRMGIKIPPEGPQYTLTVTNPTGNTFLP